MGSEWVRRGVQDGDGPLDRGSGQVVKTKKFYSLELASDGGPGQSMPKVTALVGAAVRRHQGAFFSFGLAFS
jgi:hypothetical protein